MDPPSDGFNSEYGASVGQLGEFVRFGRRPMDFLEELGPVGNLDRKGGQHRGAFRLLELGQPNFLPLGPVGKDPAIGGSGVLDPVGVVESTDDVSLTVDGQDGDRSGTGLARDPSR